MDNMGFKNYKYIQQKEVDEIIIEEKSNYLTKVSEYIFFCSFFLFSTYKDVYRILFYPSLVYKKYIRIRPYNHLCSFHFFLPSHQIA